METQVMTLVIKFVSTLAGHHGGSPGPFVFSKPKLPVGSTVTSCVFSYKGKRIAQNTPGPNERRLRHGSRWGASATQTRPEAVWPGCI